MTETYCVIDKNNFIINTILWDGKTTYSPGSELILVKASTLPNGIGIGCKKENNKWLKSQYNHETGEETWTEIN